MIKDFLHLTLITSLLLSIGSVLGAMAENRELWLSFSHFARLSHLISIVYMTATILMFNIISAGIE